MHSGSLQRSPGLAAQEPPNVLLNQGPSEPCYATGKTWAGTWIARQGAMLVVNQQFAREVIVLTCTTNCTSFFVSCTAPDCTQTPAAAGTTWLLLRPACVWARTAMPAIWC